MDWCGSQRSEHQSSTQNRSSQRLSGTWVPLRCVQDAYETHTHVLECRTAVSRTPVPIRARESILLGMQGDLALNFVLVRNSTRQ